MISAIVLTHNDSENLIKTLASLSWCDERIVIDDNSEENIKKIAADYHAQYYCHALNENFSQQRNFGLSKATSEWVLFVDSDEVVTSVLADEINKTIQDTHHSGFLIQRRDSMWGKILRHGEVGNMAFVRLARKNAGLWSRPVHESWNVQGTVGRLKNPILHYPHTSVSSFLSEINTYSTLNAQFLYSQKTQVYGWHIVAYPFGKFVLNYVWRLGFIDGIAGFIFAMMMSFHSFLSRAKLYLLYYGKNSHR